MNPTKIKCIERSNEIVLKLVCKRLGFVRNTDEGKAISRCDVVESNIVIGVGYHVQHIGCTRGRDGSFCCPSQLTNTAMIAWLRRPTTHARRPAGSRSHPLRTCALRKHCVLNPFLPTSNDCPQSTRHDSCPVRFARDVR